MLIHLKNDSELIAYETMALAFVLASFDYTVQLQFDNAVIPLLNDDNSRLYGMVQALPLYDLPPIWVDDLSAFLGQLPNQLEPFFSQKPNTAPLFDSTITA